MNTRTDDGRTLDEGRPRGGALRPSLALLLGGALLMSACGAADDERSPQTPARPTTGKPAPPPTPPSATAPRPEPALIAPTAGRAERAVPWKLVGKRGGGRQLVLEIQLGGPPCDALTAVVVRETRRAVTITVRAGRVPGARCGPGVQAVVGTFRAVAQLVDPLGDRRLVQGSRRG